MKELSNYIKSDLFKLWHSWFFITHIIFLAMAVFITQISKLLYKNSNEGMLLTFFQLLGVALPFAVSIVTYILVDQETRTSCSQNILILSSRLKVIISKIIILITSGLITISIGTVLMNMLNSIGIITGWSFGAIFILWGTSIWLYVIYTFLAFRFGKNACISLGVVGSLLAVLLRTGLGQGVWHLIPFGWGANIVEIFIFSNFSKDRINQVSIDTHSGLVFVVTVISIIFLFIWFRRYDGRTTAD